MAGYHTILLHAHLPFVRHPEWDNFLEEDWYYEAVTETYLPLLQMFERLTHDGVDWRLTMSLTPPLLNMMADPLLRERYHKHLHHLSDLVDKELERTTGDDHLHYLANHYREVFDEALRTWYQYEGDLIRGFRRFLDQGNLEVITCGATHGYLPLMQVHPPAVWAQLKVAVDTHEKYLGRKPDGIWLPECGYYPGLDQMVRDAGLRFFVVDAHGVTHATPRPRHGNAAPIYCAGSGVAAFGRDMESSEQVWSKEIGYPGDANYREFYRDIGWDLELDYIGDWVQPTGDRKNTGIKYHCVTGKVDLRDKDLYNPHNAREMAATHAGNFVFNRTKQLDHLSGINSRPAHVLSPYDAELYGHWWYEGPWWLEYVLRKATFDQDTYRMVHLGEYLQENPTQQVATPAQSSWGAQGYHNYWINGTNDWIYRHLHDAAGRMIKLAGEHEHTNGLFERALNQAARELLLAQSSDWAFIMSSDTMVEYAVRRTREGLERFHHLCDMVERGDIDEHWLSKVEATDSAFQGIDFRVYKPL